MYTHDLKDLVGRRVSAVHMNTEVLAFETDKGQVVYGVEGDCCSHSYFHDIVGVRKLLDNGPVASTKEINMADPEPDNDDEYVKVYGYEIVTEHPQWGEQTTVVSFRNYSNGYYGGWLTGGAVNEPLSLEKVPALTEDWMAD